MNEPKTPQAWANFLSRLWGPRFPVDVQQIAREYSMRFSDPVRKIVAAPIEDFEGALLPMPKRPGWAILYNPAIRSPGRINFTLGHELGHYLLHRLGNPEGFKCGQSEALGVAREPRRERIEHEADLFASYLLMPLDDFRAQAGCSQISADLLQHCADRYGVSLTAAALKWLEATAECAVIVVAINGFVLWCRRSASATKARIYFPSGMELPLASLAANNNYEQPSEGTFLAPGIWGSQAVREIAIFADSYEMTISLLIFEGSARAGAEWHDEEPEDCFDRIVASSA